MKLKLVALFAIAATMISCATNKNKKETDDLKNYLNSYIEQNNFPGASFAWAKDGKIIHTITAGYADVEAKRAPFPETLFRIASTTKPITAVTIFKLLEDSNVDFNKALDRKVFGSQGYLPEYKNILDKRVYQITLRDLLQHTAGWNSGLGYDPQYDLYNIAVKMKVKAPAGPEDVIRYMLRYKKLDVAPGKEYHYSNLGYNVLARIIEKMSGEKYEKYVQKKILFPLGITDMVIAGNTLADRKENEARYYDDPRHEDVLSIVDNKTKGPMAYNAYNFATMDGHGGFLGTATDLVKFLNGVTPESGDVQLLKPATVEFMTKPVANIGNPGASLSFVVQDGGKTLLHAGALETGTLAYMIRRSDGNVWAVLFNRLPVKDGSEIQPLAQKFIDGLEPFMNKK